MFASVSNLNGGAYGGGESVTLKGGLIIKMGSFVPSSNPDTHSFAVAFPTALIGLAVGVVDNTNPMYYLTAAGASGFTGIGASSQPSKVWFVACGY